MTVLTIPGLYNSGPEHWQSHWERTHGFTRVQQRSFNTPLCSDWVENIEAAVLQNGQDVVLVGHSCGAIAIAHWAAKHPRNIKGAMLVAPSDVERDDFPPEAVGFNPIPTTKLPFPTIVVASDTDPYVTPERTKEFAEAWGAKFVNIGDAGHINTLSGFGPWPEGLELLDTLLK